MRQTNKCSLILRLWRGDYTETRDWRASVEIPEAGKRLGFSNLEQLFAFLLDFTDTNCDIHVIDDKDGQAI